MKKGVRNIHKCPWCTDFWKRFSRGNEMTFGGKRDFFLVYCSIVQYNNDKKTGGANLPDSTFYVTGNVTLSLSAQFNVDRPLA